MLPAEEDDMDEEDAEEAGALSWLVVGVAA